MTYIGGLEIPKTKKVARICKSFAKQIYGDDLEKPTKNFDQCGFIKESDPSFKFEGSKVVGVTPGEKTVIIPSKTYANANEFFNDSDVKPLFLGDHQIIIVDESELDPLKGETCFKI